MSDPLAIGTFKAKYYVDDDALSIRQEITMPAERIVQYYRLTYNDIRDWLWREKSANEKETSKIDWNDVIFEVDLLKSHIFTHYLQGKNLIEQIITCISN